MPYIPDPMSNKQFQLHTKTICLTYSNVKQQLESVQHPMGLWADLFTDAMGDATRTKELADSFYARISDRIDSRRVGIRYCIIAFEKHADGNPHVHIGIKCDTQFRSKDPRIFDLDDVHPCIEPAKSFPKWRAYCQKDENYYEYGAISDFTTKVVRITPQELITLAKSMNKAEFLAYCSVHKYMYAPQVWEEAHPDLASTLLDITPVEGTYDPKFDRLVTNMIWEQDKALLLVGKSGIGKTTWAKRTIKKPCLMVSHLDDLRKFNPDFHNAILFDDVSIKHLPDTAQIHMVDYHNPRSIHCRYATARIPSGIQKIFTCNTVPVNWDMEAIQRRCQLVFCTEMVLRDLQ